MFRKKYCQTYILSQKQRGGSISSFQNLLEVLKEVRLLLTKDLISLDVKVFKKIENETYQYIKQEECFINKKDILRKLTNLRLFYLNKTGFFLKRQNNFKAT